MAIVHVSQRDPEALIDFFPCDHHYSDQLSFRLTVRSAADCREQYRRSIILVGAEAEYPEIEYGWIEPGSAVSHATVRSLYRVNQFLEKPALPQARALLRNRCLWNTFVTMGTAATFLELLCSLVPVVVRSIT